MRIQTGLDPLCERACSNVAVGTLSIHWTVVDFMDVDVCEEHIAPSVEKAWRMKVDNQTPVDVWFMRWED